MPEHGRVSIFGLPGLGFLTKLYVNFWHTVTPWVAVHVFHLSGKVTTYFPTGSGDTTLDYIENLLYVVFAVAAAVVWSIAERKRLNYKRLHAWLRLLIRYTLAFTLFGYGFAKVFPLQFQPPHFYKLTEQYSDFSPMGVLWSFMGASVPYIIFSGAAEVLGGLLLLARRTATLGAMISAAVLLNILVLNLCYDVPVKLYSANLLLMAAFLLAPDLRRLGRVLVLNRMALPADLSAPRFQRLCARIAAVSFQILFVGFWLFTQLRGGWMAYSQTYLHPKRPPIYGLYDVDVFTLNGQVHPPLLTDTTRWNKVMIDFPTFIQVRMMDNSLQGWGAKYDVAKSAVMLSRGGNKSASVLHYSRSDADHVLLDGQLNGQALSVRLRRVDASKFLLVSRGFHWINEMPFNR